MHPDLTAALDLHVRRAAVHDHQNRDTLGREFANSRDFRHDGLAVACYRDARKYRFDYGTLPVQLVKIERVTFFDRTAPYADGTIGEIELTYSKHGYRAIYGFTRTGDTVLFAD